MCCVEDVNFLEEKGRLLEVAVLVPASVELPGCLCVSQPALLLKKIQAGTQREFCGLTKLSSVRRMEVRRITLENEK